MHARLFCLLGHKNNTHAVSISSPTSKYCWVRHCSNSHYGAAQLVIRPSRGVRRWRRSWRHWWRCIWSRARLFAPYKRRIIPKHTIRPSYNCRYSRNFGWIYTHRTELADRYQPLTRNLAIANSSGVSYAWHNTWRACTVIPWPWNLG